MQRVAPRARIATVAGAVGLTISLLLGATAPLVHAQRSNATLFVTGAGSTFIAPLMQKWTFSYSTTVNKSVRINYQAVGSGAGVASLFANVVNFAGSDAYLTDAQLKSQNGNAVHIPLTIGPVAMLYNLPGISSIKLDGTTLAQMYMGKITAWNDKAIAAQNPGVNLPNTPVTVVHRSDGSGTSFIFTNYLAAVDSTWKNNVGAGTTVNWPTGEGGKGTPGVAAIVKRTPGGIGYAELSYALSTGLPAATIKNNAGQYVYPSPATAAACAASAPSIPSDLRALLVTCTGKNAYPITGISWGIVRKNYTSGAMATYSAMLNFFWWAIHSGQKGYPTSGLLRYAPLPPSIVTADEKAIKSVTYNGKQIYK
jgi:phosphate transport system substrate-binding protein